MIRVAISGFSGKLGSALLPFLLEDPDVDLVAGFSRTHKEGAPLDQVHSFSELLGTGPQLLLDVSQHEGAASRLLEAIEAGVSPVIGVTGFEQAELDALNAAAKANRVPAIYAPNFAVGAVLMMRFAEMASRWFGDIEVIEMHHDRKLDSPSGTAMMTLDRLARHRQDPTAPQLNEQEKVTGARGGVYDGIHVHSVRLPGLVAHQIVMFGGPGEGLTIRHDAYDRACYGKGALLCLKKVLTMTPGLHRGLDSILFDQAGSV